MITTANIYRLALSGSGYAESLKTAFQGCNFEVFTPCAPTQERSVGFVPPRGEGYGYRVELVNGQLILKLMTEVKSVPGPVVKRAVEDKVAQITQVTGRKPGKKETRELQEDARLALLPMAFAKQAASLVWIDPAARWLVIDAASPANADEVVTQLIKHIPGLTVSPINTKASPAHAMANWLVDAEPPTGFSVDRECELKASDESKSVVKYSRHALDNRHQPLHRVYRPLHAAIDACCQGAETCGAVAVRAACGVGLHLRKDRLRIPAQR